MVKQKVDLDKYLGSCPGMDAEKLSEKIKRERRRGRNLKQIASENSI